jgi:hypothetical protein
MKGPFGADADLTYFGEGKKMAIKNHKEVRKKCQVAFTESSSRRVVDFPIRNLTNIYTIQDREKK